MWQNLFGPSKVLHQQISAVRPQLLILVEVLLHEEGVNVLLVRWLHVLIQRLAELLRLTVVWVQHQTPNAAAATAASAFDLHLLLGTAAAHFYLEI